MAVQNRCQGASFEFVGQLTFEANDSRLCDFGTSVTMNPKGDLSNPTRLVGGLRGTELYD